MRLARSSDESEQKPGVSPSSSLGFGRCSPDDSEQQQQPALWPALAGRVTCRGLRPPPARRVRAATAWAKRHRSSDESPSPFLPHARQTSPSSNFWPLLPTFLADESERQPGLPGCRSECCRELGCAASASPPFLTTALHDGSADSSRIQYFARRKKKTKCDFAFPRFVVRFFNFSNTEMFFFYDDLKQGVRKGFGFGFFLRAFKYISGTLL